ncbi:linear amide C-N hydrolase [Shewanella sp. YLB-07]|uniref:linear amide C-N hydrolase n=1 Tax=Shewanella sp. YLB-07 TaxID=2601268 RepID=UPI001883B59F|nr:linear amide C-N hydrolase [Shewanella sp. YLB-07]
MRYLNSLSQPHLTAWMSIGIIVCLLVTISFSFACTKLVWDTDDFGVIISRTEDFGFPTEPSLEVRAKGQTYKDPNSNNPVIWTSKYSSIISTLAHFTAVEGINEAGLSMSALSLDEETNTRPIEGQQDLMNTLLVPYVVDNFKTVNEVVNNIGKINIYKHLLNGSIVGGHYMVQDKSGDSAVIEILDGKFKIYHGPENNVLTNSPAYNFQLKNWEKLKPKSTRDIIGSFPLPGNAESSQRFVRGKYMLEALPTPTSYINAILTLESALPSSAINIPYKHKKGKMIKTASQYSITYGLNQKIIYFQYRYQNSFTLFSTDFNKLNDGKNYTLDATRADLAGDVTGEYKEGLGVMQLYLVKHS